MVVCMSFYLCQLVERIQNVFLHLHFMLQQLKSQLALGFAAHIHHLAVHMHRDIYANIPVITTFPHRE